MSWTGLTSESKQFCSYETKSASKKIRWWFDYVFSAAPSKQEQMSLEAL